MIVKGISDTTYIQISKTVADELNKRKLVPRESYEDVLRRLLKLDKRQFQSAGKTEAKKTKHGLSVKKE